MIRAYGEDNVYIQGDFEVVFREATQILNMIGEFVAEKLQDETAKARAIEAIAELASLDRDNLEAEYARLKELWGV